MEHWKPVVGYEGLYEVSDRGNVRSLDRTSYTITGKIRTLKGRNVKSFVGYKGYVYVNLRKEKKSKLFRVHRLVLDAFKGVAPDGMIARHLDGNPENNTPDNLQWGTPSENMYDKQKHGTDHEKNKTHCPRGHAYSGNNLIVYTRKDGRTSRYCKACKQIQGSYGTPENFKELADERYRLLTGGIPAS